MRDEGVLSNVIVRKANLVYPETYGEMTYRNEIEFLYENEHRNKFLTNLCSKLDKNILLLVNRLEHGFILLNYFLEPIATQRATDAPTIGLLPIPMRPIMSTWAGTDEEPANCASECILPIVSVIP